MEIHVGLYSGRTSSYRHCLQCSDSVHRAPCGLCDVVNGTCWATGKCEYARPQLTGGARAYSRESCLRFLSTLTKSQQQISDLRCGTRLEPHFVSEFRHSLACPFSFYYTVYTYVRKHVAMVHTTAKTQSEVLFTNLFFQLVDTFQQQLDFSNTSSQNFKFFEWFLHPFFCEFFQLSFISTSLTLCKF